MKVKIIRLSMKDAHYHDSKELIGLVGDAEIDLNRKGAWKSISFIPDNNPWPHLPVIHFFAVEIERVKDE